MDNSPFFDPRVVIPIVFAAISLIVWFVRLENKNSANSEAIKRLEAEVDGLWKDFESHRQNQDIHFNLRVSNQVEQANERRFSMIERQLNEINSKLDKMAEKR